MIEFVVGVLLAAAAVWFVLYPIFRYVPGAASTPQVGYGEEEDPADDLSSHAVALRALKEIEFDRATGKLSDADYDSLHRKYTAEALEAMRAEGAPREGPAAAAQRAAGGVGPARVAATVCPTHGPRPEADAQFCSECGRRLGVRGGYCARCGSGLEDGARYCHACGSRIAA